MKALDVHELHTYYDKSHILDGVSLHVQEGELVTLLGRNGAGKSTTLRSIMGLTHARSGTVTAFGQDTTQWPPYRIAALGVGFVPERSEEHTSELQSLMRISYAVFCLKNKTTAFTCSPRQTARTHH